MNNEYKSVFDKLKLNEQEKEKAKALWQANTEKEENHMKKKRSWKPVAAFAACMILILTVTAVIPRLQKNYGKTENSFTITAYAEELKEGGKVSASKSVSHFNCDLAYDKEGKPVGEINYTYEFPFICKGENIETIEYQINDGAFQIMNEKDDRIVLSGAPLSEKMEGIMFMTPDGKALEIDGGMPEQPIVGKGGKVFYEWEQYHSFTLGYDKQSDEGTTIYIVGNSSGWSEEKLAKFREIVWKMEAVPPEETEGREEELGKYYEMVSSPEIDKQIYDFVLEGSTITCTVTYKDGSTVTKNIAVTSEIMKESDVFPESGSDENEAFICFRIE